MHFLHCCAHALQQSASCDSHCFAQARHIFSQRRQASSANSEFCSNKLAHTRHIRSQVVQILEHSGRSFLQHSAQLLHSFAHSLHAATHFALFGLSAARTAICDPTQIKATMRQAIDRFMELTSQLVNSRVNGSHYSGPTTENDRRSALNRIRWL
jgi:hypothetical protein